MPRSNPTQRAHITSQRRLLDQDWHPRDHGARPPHQRRRPQLLKADLSRGTIVKDRPPVKPLTHVRDIVVLGFRPLNCAFGDQDDFRHPLNLGVLGQAGNA